MAHNSIEQKYKHDCTKWYSKSFIANLDNVGNFTEAKPGKNFDEKISNVSVYVSKTIDDLEP